MFQNVKDKKGKRYNMFQNAKPNNILKYKYYMIWFFLPWMNNCIVCWWEYI